MRVVLYAEGPGDAPWTRRLKPTDALPEDHHGPAHVLVRRCLPEPVEFFVPLRAHGGRLARGSDLRSSKTLRRLLTWPRIETRPDVAVVLVDEDGDNLLRVNLEKALATLPVSTIVGAPARELEAWLLADIKTVSSVAGAPVSPPPRVDGLPRGRAKELLAAAIGSDDAFAKRIEIAKRCDLGVLDKLPAFEAFRKALQAAAP